MLYVPKLLSLFITIDQETVLKWFGLEDTTSKDAYQLVESSYGLNVSNFETSTDVSLETFRLIIDGLWSKIQDGLTLSDIENVLFFILFIRFVILTVRYNLKTSFYITSIGLFAGYLWYRHLIDLISMYRNVLIKLPFLHKLGLDAVQLRSMHRQMVRTDLKLGEDVHWYDPIRVLYYAFTKGIISIDPETGFRYYVDPLSMVVSVLPNSMKVKVIPFYYKVYHTAIPKILSICSKYWNQLVGVAAYSIITRMGKKYCPYLIRWHWTLLLIIGTIEQIFIYFIYRVYYFQTFVILPKMNLNLYYPDPNLSIQMNFLNAIIASVVLMHIGFVLFGLFHAIWGQYFYVPFFIENTELHVGPRPKNSLYSGGNTAWQDPKEKEKSLNRLLPKLWYGWFGRGTNNGFKLKLPFQKFFRRLLK